MGRGSIGLKHLARGQAAIARRSRFIHVWRDHGLMKLLTFPAYDPAAKAGTEAGLPASAYTLLLRAHFAPDNQLGDDPANAKIAKRLKQALFGGTQIVDEKGNVVSAYEADPNTGIRRMIPAGTVLVLHESEYSALTAAWNRLRPKLPSSMADEVCYLQELIEKVETLTPAEVDARQAAPVEPAAPPA